MSRLSVAGTPVARVEDLDWRSRRAMSVDRRLFLFAYICSGFAGLVYEVSWTRLLTLFIGHTTGAASAVIAAFLGGLAGGAALGGAIASRLTARRALQAYVALELVVAIAALLLPLEVRALRPLLAWAYQDGAAGPLFPAIRLLSCLLMVFVPASALGATFPLAIRYFAADTRNPARFSGLLYALNTVGAAIGSVLAGFLLIPAIGVSGTTGVGVAASLLAATSVAIVLWRVPGEAATPANQRAPVTTTSPRRARHVQTTNGTIFAMPPPWLAIVVLGLTGFGALVHEIAWTRILALVLGPTIYAFAATLAVVIAGVAIGSAIGTFVIGRTARAAEWLAFFLAVAAVATSYTYSLAGSRIPRLVAEQMASSTSLFDQLLRHGLLLTIALILPTATCLGAAFPLALAMQLPIERTTSRSPETPEARRHAAPARFGLVYAVNTVGAVLGSLAAGFLLIPNFGLQRTLMIVSACLIVAAVSVIAWGLVTMRSRLIASVATIAAAGFVIASPPWDRELLASGAYLYAPFVPKDLDLETLLKAGTLLYYREGAASTVSVKRLTGTTTLAVDGKTDASNRGDMLTQKLVAHLPLLLHDNPREVAVIGLGSGVTLGAALRHPIQHADVVEISPEVVEASQYFDDENHRALTDPRARLIVGDGRSHLLLSRRQYDVIISEPSNPWIAGVAALFTREFFIGARDRLAPGGIVCQWANAYNISDRDLRSIVATFTAVFPDATAWLVGADDLVLVGSATSSLVERLDNIRRHWNRPGVAADLAEVAVSEPFSVWSLFVGGGNELVRYSAGAPQLTDDRMALEFSGPRELHGRNQAENGATLASLLGPDGGPPVIRHARQTAGAIEWRQRAAMLAKRDAHTMAYDDYAHALSLDPADTVALDGFVRTAILTRRGSDALTRIKSLTANTNQTAELLVATSKLLASINATSDAIDAARQAIERAPARPLGFEQLASLYADAGEIARLDETVATLQRIAPDTAATQYYAAVSAFLHDRPQDAVRLAERAISIDPNYAPVYDVLGAALTRLDQPARAREAFQASLRFDAHDSSAYTNLGLLELAAGNATAARRYFAEALWLAPDSRVARDGLARTSAAGE